MRSKQPKTDKICKNCEKIFSSNNIRQVFCSQNCTMIFSRRFNPNYHTIIAARATIRRHKRSPEKRKQDSLRKRALLVKSQYGISIEEIERMKILQEGKCAICKKVVPLVIDHDHVTGKIRKLLCHYCNRGMGFFFDNSDLLFTAAEYIRGHK